MGDRRYLYRGRILNLALEDEHYEIVEHKNAVGIVLIQEGQVLLVRQYRVAIRCETLEIPAGLIEPGESPLEAARRELAEEAQLAADLEPITQAYLSPGFCDEQTYLFRAKNPRPAQGTPDDDEEISLEWRRPREFLASVRDGSVTTSATTLIGILALEAEI